MSDKRAKRAAPATGHGAYQAARTSALPTPERSSSQRSRSELLYCELDGLPVAVDAEDLSHAGLFAQTVMPPEVDSELDVFLRFSGASWKARGHVVQRRSCEQAAQEGTRPGCALLFTDLADDERARLRAALVTLKATHAASSAPTARATPAQGTSLRPKSPDASASASAAKPATRTAAQPAEDALLVLDRLRAELRQAETKSPWALLGLDKGSSAEQAKAAFFAASKRYHPHLFARYESADINRVVTELFIAHKRAWSSMRKSAPKPTPVEIEIERHVEPTASPPPTPVDESVRPLRVHSPAPAVSVSARSLPPDSVSRPAPLTPRTPPSGSEESRPLAVEVELRIADALKLLAADRALEAEAMLAAAAELDPAARGTRVWLLVVQARRLRGEGDAEGAKAKYLEVLTLDAKHREALNETKKHAKDAKPGLLGRFFGSGNK